MIRTRLAPSPTGFLHIGTARTALFNYLFAKHAGGQFILRIEDTDIERSKPEFEKDIIEGLSWLGLQWDEGPDVGGPYEPYRQAQRSDLYKKYLLQLKEKDLIYHCFCSKEELERERELQILSRQPPKYSGKCRSLSEAERNSLIEQGRASTLRFKITPKVFTVDDLIRGTLTFDTSSLDDFIIAKDFSTPLFVFAVVVDDYLMQISHVLRGEEHISNIPKQILLDEALGFDVPHFGHLSLILNSDRTKLSKRQNKVSLLEYRNEGILPEALINFIAFLGWNPGGDRELYTLSELVEVFDSAHVNKSGAIFDTKKLDWYNNHYLRSRPLSDITNLAVTYYSSAKMLSESSDGWYTYTETGERYSRATIEQIVDVERPRIKKLDELPVLTRFYFEKKLSFDSALLRWKAMTDDEVKNALQFSHRVLSGLDEAKFDSKNLEVALKEAIGAESMQNGAILWPLRVALSGLQASPGPFEIAAIIGKDKTLQRVTDAFKSVG